MMVIKIEDIIIIFQFFEFIQYCKGQYVICVDLKLLDQNLKVVGSGGLKLDFFKLIWIFYKK